MERNQAVEVLALLQANWSHVEVAALTGEVWVQGLREVPPDQGTATAMACIAELAHFPTVHEFIERWRAVKRGSIAPDHQPALPVPSTSAEQRQSALANLARLREQVRMATAAPNVRLTAEGEARAAAVRTPESRPPPEPCYLDDHRYCGTGPVLKRPADSAVTPSTNPTKETP